MFIREKPYHLDLSYKGERCYLHGTDIAFQLCKVLDISGEVTIQFYKMATYPILAYHVDTDELSKLRSLGKMCALMSYRDTNQEIRIVALVEDKFKVISKRKAYSESKVILGANIVNDEIVQLVANQGNFFERVVALNKELLNFSNSKNLNFIPGVSTPSEIMTAIECGNTLLKFFHSERSGGVKSLEFLFDIFNDIKFIPTGGINMGNYKSYLDLPNVLAVGSTSF